MKKLFCLMIVSLIMAGCGISIPANVPEPIRDLKASIYAQDEYSNWVILEWTATINTAHNIYYSTNGENFILIYENKHAPSYMDCDARLGIGQTGKTHYYALRSCFYMENEFYSDYSNIASTCFYN